MTRTGFVTRVMALLQGGDEAKISRFSSKVEKHINKQIAMRKEQIESLNEKIADAEEAFAEQVNTVDPARVGTTEGSESYASTYINSLNNSFERIEELREQVKSIEVEIERFNILSSKIFVD